MVQKNTLTIFLIKEGINDIDEILKEGHTSLTLDTGQLLYYEKSKPKKPDWISTFFKSDSQLDSQFKNSNSRSVLIKQINHENNIITFAITFGYGRYMIKSESINHRFGIRVAVNLIGPNNIRSISKTNLDNNKSNLTQQLVSDNSITEFEFDKHGDLISSITGKSIDTVINDTYITGSVSLKATVNYDITNIKDFLSELYSIYLKDDYKEYFSWIDNIESVKDKSLVDDLNEILLKMIKNNDKNVFMALPTLINYENFKGLKINGIKEIKNDLVIGDIVDSFRKPLNNMKQLKNKTIELISNSTGMVYDKVNSYNCLL